MFYTFPIKRGSFSLTVIRYILVILLSYVLGCSNMALYLSKLRGVDMRKGGSGNLGASNAMILMGWKAGIIVAVHDIGKAVVAVVLAKHFCPSLPLIGAAAGVACVLGHMFPFYLRFRGARRSARAGRAGGRERRRRRHCDREGIPGRRRPYARRGDARGIACQNRFHERCRAGIL